MPRALMGPDHASYLGRKTFASLDGLRAISILAVIWHHTQRRHEPGSFAHGFLGVDLFFVLSGFLIVTLLLREKDKHGAIALTAFYARRSLRIFPLYYALLFALAAVFLLKPQSENAPAFMAGLPYYLTYTSNWVILPASMMSIAWSLACEEQFYWVWPPIEKYLARYWAALLGVGLAINVAIAFAPIPKHLEVLEVTFTPILLGVLLAHLLHDPKTYARAAPFLGWRFTGPIALSATIALAAAPIDEIGGLVRTLIHASMFVLLGSVVVREDVLRVLQNPVLKRMGVVSYGMYLLHQIGLHLAHRAAAPPMATFVLGVLITWGIAEISFRTFEQRFAKMKHRFARS